jgi:hypothetical protein
MTWRLLPSAARVRPAPAAAHNSPSVRCAPLAFANDLTPCRDALHFDYASATATTSSKRPAIRLRGSRRTPFRYRYTSCTPSRIMVMKTFWQEIADLEGKASKGDIKAGIAAILKLRSAGSVGYLTLKGIAIGVVTLTPWLIPFITPAVTVQILGIVLRTYAELPQEQRRIIAIAIGWLNGRISIHE